MKRTCILMALVALLIVPRAALASWSQGFNESGVGPFQYMQFELNSGSPFANPWINEFTDSGWSAAITNPSLITASGSLPSTNLTFNLWFTDPSTNSLSFNFYAFGPDHTLLESVLASWNDGGWSFAAATHGPSAVPIPAAAWLLGSGLIGLVAIRRRFKK